MDESPTQSPKPEATSPPPNPPQPAGATDPKAAPDAKNDAVLKDLLVGLLLALRAEYLSSGASAITHWDHLKTRPLAAARMCSSLDEWFTQTRRKLQLGAPSKDSSRFLVALTSECADQGRRDKAVLRFIEKRIDMLIALARGEAEQRKERRESENS